MKPPSSSPGSSRPHHSHHGQPPRRPSIGITPDCSAGLPDTPYAHYELKVPYAEAVTRAGGLPLVLPYSEDPACVEAYLDRISGLVVTGGAFDIPPEAYGETAREGMGVVNQQRTAFETTLLKAALARSLPVLGVCGGMQLLNVVLGGTLFQDIGREVAGAREHEQKHDRAQPHHPVDVKDGTLLAEAVGKGQLMVNSTHHQAVKTCAPRAVVSAVAPDGVVEAIEATGPAFALGIQWHPELLLQSVPGHLGVYKLFVARARDVRR